MIGPGEHITTLRELLTELLRDQDTVRRIANLMAGADVRYETPGSDHPMAGRWMPDLLLDNNIRVAELMRTARPVLLDLANRADLVAAVEGWADRVDTTTATCAEPPADAVLIRPDGYVAWAAGPQDTAEGLHSTLLTWFGRPNR